MPPSPSDTSFTFSPMGSIDIRKSLVLHKSAIVFSCLAPASIKASIILLLAKGS